MTASTWFADLVLAGCEAHERVSIPGLGTFRIVTVQPKRVELGGREYVTRRRKVLKFTATKTLRDL